MGLRAVVACLPDDPDMPAAALLRLAAERFASVGGSTGPLWGTALLRAAQSLESSQSTDIAALAGAAEAAASGIALRGRCEEGDKTLLDVMAPVARALRAAAGRVRHPQRPPSARASRRRRARGNAGPDAPTRSSSPLRRPLAQANEDPGAASVLLAWEVAARLAAPGA